MSNPTATGVQSAAATGNVNTQGQPAASAPAPAATAPTSTAPAPNLPSGHASLYVGDLDEDVTEAMIYDKFSQIGNILSIRVCRDMISRKSLGYAYVNFSTPAEAEKAIDVLNFDVLRNRQMRIMWSQRDPSLRKSGLGNLFIKNLDKSIVVRDLYDTFSVFGSILSCKIATDDKGVSKGYGFVHFTSKEAAEAAIKRLTGMSLKGKTIYVAPFLPRTQRSNQGAGDPQYNNIYVKNFGDDMTEEKLKEMFSEYGDITSHVVMRNDDGSSRGFGFVCFKEPHMASNAVTAKHGSEFNGRTLFVGRAMKKAERTEHLRNQFERKKADKSSRYAVGVNLYVKNLDDSIDDDALRKEFTTFGTITSVKVMRDQLGRSKGFGFVCFSYPDDATKAVTEMNGKLVAGKPLYVALAQRKEERHMHLQSQMAQRQFTMRSGIPGAFQGPAGLMPGAMNAHAFPNAQMGAPLGMYGGFPGAGMGGGLNPGMPPGPGFYPQFARPLFQNMGMQPRPGQPRWANMGNAAPGGPQGVRPAGIMGFPQSMMRPMSMPPAANMQQRFMGQNAFPGQGGAAQPGVGARASGPVTQPMGGQGQPQRMAPPAAGNQPAQVQFALTARNIQPPTGVNPPSGPRPAGVPASTAPPADGPMEMPMDKFVTVVQSAEPDEQKQMLGEKLYSIIKGWHPDWVGKLTGMLLEIDNRELLTMIVEHRDDVPNSNLRKRVDSALQVLMANKQSSAEVAKSAE